MHAVPHRGQKRALGPLGLELQMLVELTCRCWDLNLGPLEEQLVLLTVEPSLAPMLNFLHL